MTDLLPTTPITPTSPSVVYSPTTSAATSPPTTPTPHLDTFRGTTTDWLDAVAGPNHGLRVPARVGPFRLDTEVTLGAAWTLLDGSTWRSLSIVPLRDDRGATRRLPAVTAEVGVTPDGDGLAYAQPRIAASGRLARWLTRAVVRDVHGTLEAALRAASRPARSTVVEADEEDTEEAPPDARSFAPDLCLAVGC